MQSGIMVPGGQGDRHDVTGLEKGAKRLDRGQPVNQTKVRP
jgi:hypothetical protein